MSLISIFIKLFKKTATQILQSDPSGFSVLKFNINLCFKK